jgi:hypothetical protein
MTMYAYCVYSAILKSPNQLSENDWKLFSVVSSVMSYTVTVSFCHSTWIRYQKALLGSWLKNTEVFLTSFISTQNHTIAG